MQIGALAHATGLSTRQIRYWTEHGLLENRRDTNGYRMYDKDSQDRALRIHTLLESGLSIDEVSQLTGCLDLDSGVCERERAALSAKRKEIDRRISCLQRAQELIDKALALPKEAE